MEKTIPVLSRPGNHCAFNGSTYAPYPITRIEAAKVLRSMRLAVRRGNGRLIRNGPGAYALIGLNTLLLATHPGTVQLEMDAS